jgi:sulfur relay (sulfurtransferase) complex TusBCD TusD component (DsrE family)
MVPRIFRVLILLAIMALSHATFANNKEPIFINLATNEPDKVLMALDAASQYSEKGFPIVIYLNDKAVVFGVVKKGVPPAKVQIALQKAIASGAVVNICPTCLDKYGFTSANLAPGITRGTEH